MSSEKQVEEAEIELRHRSTARVNTDFSAKAGFQCADIDHPGQRASKGN
jgi:hypothetical protein